MDLTNRIELALFCLIFSASLFAAQITGSVTNGTSNKPSSGDNVVLLSLSGGMNEVAHTKTGASGHFSLATPQQNGPYLVRVEHQGVNYFKRVPDGESLVNVTVYDAANTVDHLVFDGRVFRFQTMPNGHMEVAETFILRNESSPPRTKSGATSFDFDLPAGAQIEEGVAQSPGGMPTNMRPIPVSGKNRYGFAFPLRPGRTRFQVTYNVPYAGTREFKVTPELPLTELGIMLPRSMKFNSSDPELGRSPDVDGLTVFVEHNIPAGKELKFSVSGEGVIPGQGAPESQAENTAPAAALEPAANPPADTYSNSRWYVIGIFIIAIAGGAYWLFRVQRRSPSAHTAGADPVRSRLGTRKPKSSPALKAAGSSAASGTQNNDVLNAIKEELFQLEKDRAQGKLSQEDYTASKASLDAIMRRNLKKS